MPEHLGRFAPSPTGPLHAGSLVAAVGSFLCARKNAGQWLLRIEDLDPPREAPGAADSILQCLEAHGLLWDGEVVYQSQRHDAYLETVNQLMNEGKAYCCQCSRKQIAATGLQSDFGPVYPGTCRAKQLVEGAVRIRTHNRPIGFDDHREGHYEQKLESQFGDFVIQRRDGLFAYQLAVVLDDARENITHVVRGTDLLDNTPRQIHLQQILELNTPEYLHLPLVRNEGGQKLSKQNLATPLDNASASENLIEALRFLGFRTARLDKRMTTTTVLDWATSEADWGHSAIHAYAD